MKLHTFPTMPNKQKPELIGFGGLNVSDNAKAGELRAARNLTSDYFPFLGTRKQRSVQGTYSRPTALFDWNGLVLVDGTDLYYNGTKVGTVSAGEKEFAVVNTKLVIWPDKKYLDLTNNQFKEMESSLTSAANSATFTGNSITMNITPKIGAESAQFSYATTAISRVMTYTAVSWTSNGGWTKTGGTEKAINALSTGDIIIPTKVASSGAYVVGIKTDGAFPAENNDGRYFKVTSKVNAPQTAYRWQVYDYYVLPGPPQRLVTTNFVGYRYGNLGDYPEETTYYDVAEGRTLYAAAHDNYPLQASTTLSYDVYAIGTGPYFSDYLKAGDLVTISGCTTYAANNYSAPTTMSDQLPVIATVASDTLTFSKSLFSAGSEVGAVTIKKYVPSFDHVCAKDNRLWGVWQNLIYGSALGDPSTFFDYSGDAEDSYVTPIGTKGNFTGICAYSSEIFCWKEDVLHRIIGGYPAEYVLYTDNIPGLQSGCQKSQVIINDILYYKSKQGIYSYSGNAPRLVGYNLGLNMHFNTVSGTDGLKYYASMLDIYGNWCLYVYDPLRGVWFAEDALHVTDFAYRDGTQFILDPGSSKVYSIGPVQGVETVQWSAEFVEFTESVLNKKAYSKIYLRVQLDGGASLLVETSSDGAPFKQVYITANDTVSTKTLAVPLLPSRCDEFRLRLSGTGKCIIKAMEREFVLGSEA